MNPQKIKTAIMRATMHRQKPSKCEYGHETLVNVKRVCPLSISLY